MALLGSQSRYLWLLSLPYWAGSGLSVLYCLLALASPAAAASNTSRPLTSVEIILADEHEQDSLPEETPSDSSESEASPEDMEAPANEAVEEMPESESDSTPTPTESQETPDSIFVPDDSQTAPLPPPGSAFPGLPSPQSAPPLQGPNLRNFILGEPSEVDFDTYRLGPGDSFFVSVRQFPDLSFQATLDIQGNVVVPLQGVTSFRDLTLDQAAARIADIYDQFVVNPEVGVTLIAQRGVEVTILGEVEQPGFYPLPDPQLLTALLSAGGTTGLADLRKVTIQRRLSEDNQVIDLFSPMQDGAALPDVALQDGDVIIVERLDPTVMDEYDRDLVARSTLAQPVITVRFLNYGAGGIGGATAGTLTAIDLPNGSRFADVLTQIGLNPDTSNLREIGLVRFDEEAGQAVTLTLDGNAAFRGETSENPPLQDNDVIIVNRTLLARITYGFSVFTQPFRDLLGFILFFDSLAESAGDLFAP